MTSNVSSYLGQVEQKSKGLAFELVSLKLINEVKKVQRKGIKKYDITKGYTGFKFYVGPDQFYEQDVMVFLEQKLGFLSPFYKFWQSIRNCHRTKNMIVQCKNYSGKVGNDNVDHDLNQIGMGGIMGYNLPVSTVIIKEDNNPFLEYRFKRRYHILDVVEPDDFDTSYLNTNFESIQSKSHLVALKDFGKVRMTYNSAENISTVSLDDIVTYVNNKRTRKVRIKKHEDEIGNLFLVLHNKKPQLVNVIKYSKNPDKKIVTINDEKELRNTVVKIWQFLNPELVFYLTENGITKRGLKHIKRVGANPVNLDGLLGVLKQGKLLKKMDTFEINLERDQGRSMSANAEIRLIDSVDDLLDEGKYKNLTKKKWDKSVEKFLYNKIRKSNFAIKK